MYRPIPDWKPSTPPIDSAEYEEIVHAHPIVAIHFWARWNGVDPPFDAALQAVSELIKARIHFVSCDIDDPKNMRICRAFAFANIPYLGILVDGNPSGGIMGLRETAELESALVARLESSIATAGREGRRTRCFSGAGLARIWKSVVSRLRPRE